MVETLRQLESTAETEAYLRMLADAFQLDSAVINDLRERFSLNGIWGLFIEGVMCAGMLAQPLRVVFGGVSVRVWGLSYLTIPPELRRMGHTKRMLAKLITASREAGLGLVAFYPFSYSFYKRYGWQFATVNHKYTIPMNHLPQNEPIGTWHAVRRLSGDTAVNSRNNIHPDDLSVLANIYEAWALTRNCTLLRDEKWWRNRKLGIGSYTYYWKNKQGEARCYVTYNYHLLDSGERQIHVALVAHDSDSFSAALSFLRSHESQVKEVVLTQPEDSRILAVLADPTVRVELEPTFMLRVVNVVQALQERGWPSGDFRTITIAVNDHFTSENQGTFSLQIRGGVATVERTGGPVEITLDQATLCHLYTGYLSPHEAARLGLLEARSQDALIIANSLFTGMRPYIEDYF